MSITTAMNDSISLSLVPSELPPIKSHHLTSDILSALWAIKNNSQFFPPSLTHTNDTRALNFYYQFWLHSYYNPYSNSTVNENFQFLSCSSIYNTTGKVIAMILYIIVCCVGLFGNTLVIYVVLKFSKMQTVTNRYILNLAIADESFLIGIPFLLTTMYLNEWIFGSFLCKLYMVSTSITQFSSSIFLLIMSADRFIAVCHPISSPRFRTQLVSKIVSLLAWGYSALIMLPVMLYANTAEKFPGSEQMTCNIIWNVVDGNVQGGLTFTLYSLILGFAVPLSLILVFYYLVIRKLRQVGTKHKSKDKKRSHRKVTRLVLTVITVYIFCWSPYWVSQIALINSSPHVCQSKLEITIFLLIGCMGYSNSAINPILYAFLSDNFKKSFMKACMCTRGKDFNAQLQFENSIFPRFGRSARSSEKLSALAKSNFHKTKTTIVGKESEAITTAAVPATSVIMEQDKSKNFACTKTTMIAPNNHIENKTHNNSNGINETANETISLSMKVQRTEVLHTDL